MNHKDAVNLRIASIESQLYPKERTAKTEGAFVYTVDGVGSLSQEQRLFYEENGYIVVKGLFSPEDIKKYDNRFVEICRNPSERATGLSIGRDITTAKAGIKINDEKHIHKINDFMDDGTFSSYPRHPPMVEVIKSICGDDVKCIQSMLINKPPHIGQTTRHPLHQDLLYFPVRPYNTICASWTAMVPMTRENGCLVAIPGSHRAEVLFPHGYPKWEKEGGVNKYYFGIQELPKDLPPLSYLEMDAGDTIFFHPLLIHGSGTNRSDNFRIAISCHFSSAKNHFVDPKAGMRGEYEKELEEQYNKIYKSQGQTYLDVWRFKSRSIAGKEYEGRI
jgi:phytanoyl-CoA hydroxylase